MKTQKINKIARNKTRLTMVILLAIATIAILALYLPALHIFHNKSDIKTIDQKNQEIYNNKNKKELIETNSKEPKKEQSTTPSAVFDIQVSTHIEASNDITVQTQLKNLSDGVCSLSVTNGTTTHTQTAVVIYQPLFSTCAGFNIPNNTLTPGTWEVTLSVTSNGLTATKAISMEVQ